MQKVLLKFPQHHAHITVTDTGRINVFKFNERTCDLNSFTNQEEASEWVMEPLPVFQYVVTIQNDE
jgi:hypothetical protein